MFSFILQSNALLYVILYVHESENVVLVFVALFRIQFQLSFEYRQESGKREISVNESIEMNSTTQYDGSIVYVVSLPCSSAVVSLLSLPPPSPSYCLSLFVLTWLGILLPMLFRLVSKWVSFCF